MNNIWRVVKDVFTGDSQDRLEKAFRDLDSVITEIMYEEFENKSLSKSQENNTINRKYNTDNNRKKSKN